MKIRPKNTILFAQKGVKFSQNNLRGANWRQLVFNNYRLHLLDLLAKYGNDKTYGNWLNEMLSRHHQIYTLAGGKDGNWEDTAYQNDLVGLYQQDYRGGIDNNGQYKRYGSILLKDSDRYDFNQTGIKTNLNTRYIIDNPSLRTSGDYSRNGYNYKVDNLYSAITDDRRLLGREGDWDENSQEFKDWQSSLNKLGWKMEKDLNDKYYYLKRLNNDKWEDVNYNDVTGVKMDLKPIKPLDIEEYNKQEALKRLEKDLVTSKIIGDGKPEPPIKISWWNKLSKTLNKYGPDILEAGRLAGNLRNNQLVYEAVKKGIVPNLRDSYHTYAQVKGDEGTKLAYYRRAVQGEAQAAKPFVSDADKTMAYRNEAKRIGDEARAQGDLADNAEVRRTSDISDLHAWTNVARDNEVAGYNSAELNRVKGILANLDAQKLSADWTNLDTYLLGKEYRWRDKLDEYRAATRQKNQILYQNAIDTDPRLVEINKEILKHYESNGRIIDDRIRELLKLQKQRLRDLELEWFDPVVLGKDYVEYAKNGTTITYKKKKKDDLLYKLVKDTIEHFRKMVKMSDDSRIKSSKKDNKRLILPPKTKKMQLGGIAPFTFYKPVALGGETSTQVSSTGSSSSNSSSKSGGSGKDEKLEFIKKLYLDMIGAGKGIPIDVSLVANNMTKAFEAASLLGNEISTDLLASMYMSAALLLSLLLYSKQILDNAEKVATANGALDEYAVTSDGKYIVQDTKGDLKKVGLEQIKQGGLNPLTNNQLLFLRNNTPQMALRGGDMIMQEVVANSIGMSKINDEIIKMASNLGTDEIVKEGYTKQQAGEIKRGLELLLEAPAGDYKYTLTDKNLLRQANLAQEFILRGLPKNYKAVLEINALENKMTPELYIGAIIGSRTSNTQHLEFDAVTGKASESSKNSEGDSEKIIPAVAFFNGLGEKDSFIILDKTNDGLKIDVISATITSKGYNTGSISFDKLESSDFGGLLLMNLATMGDSLISSTGRNNIIIDGRIYLAELPIDLEAKRTTGIIKPDLRFLKKIEAADTKLRQMGIDKSDPKNIAIINKVYLENNLPILYTISNNKPTITSEYARFAIVNGVGTEDAFGDNPEFNDAILEISSDKERLLFETMMLQLGNSKYKLDNGIGIFGYSIGETKLYKGTIYIPIVTSNISALAGTGFKANGEEYNEIEARQQAANAAREMGFNPAGNASNLL